uniref:Uncharacterized protein n=1 Tax=Knipowitschia caucasica TaxID=637954 RepID=A0AAV2JJ27_KNICA
MHYEEFPQDDMYPTRADMEELQRERYFAQQAHERMRAGLADVQAIHTSMQQLLNRAENLQLTTPPHQPPFTVIDEEEDWPPPPPPPPPPGWLSLKKNLSLTRIPS